jgi:hypothetical protein
VATQQSNGIDPRVAQGDALLEAAAHAATRPVAERLSRFRKLHTSYRGADGAVLRTSLALHRQQAKIGAADDAADSALFALAEALVAEGLPKANPFKPFGALAPEKLADLGYGEEARKVVALSAAVAKRPGMSRRAIAAARAASRAASHVQDELGPMPDLQKRRADAIARRDGIGQLWETALAGLKRRARAAEQEGAKGLYAALFERKGTAQKASRPRTSPR